MTVELLACVLGRGRERHFRKKQGLLGGAVRILARPERGQRDGPLEHQSWRAGASEDVMGRAGQPLLPDVLSLLSGASGVVGCKL